MPKTSLYDKYQNQLFSSREKFAWSAGTVEYTDCFSAETPPTLNKCSGYDTKQSVGEVPVVLELWGMWSAPLLPLLPGPLWPRVVAPDRVLSMGHHHHHHIALVARISLTLSRHSSLSFIALGRSSGQHPVSSHSCWMYVRAGRPAFARQCVGVHKSTSLMSSSLLLQQCPACLVRLTWIVFLVEGRWPYSWCLVGCCRQ